MTNELSHKSEIIQRIDRFRRHLAELKKGIHSTENRVTGKTRSESEEHLHHVLNDTSDVIHVVDNRGIIRYESPSAHRIFGVHEKNPRIGTSVFSFFHPEGLK
jgi:PAS domain-containing protein